MFGSTLYAEDAVVWAQGCERLRDKAFGGTVRLRHHVRN